MFFGQSVVSPGGIHFLHALLFRITVQARLNPLPLWPCGWICGFRSNASPGSLTFSSRFKTDADAQSAAFPKPRKTWSHRDWQKKALGSGVRPQFGLALEAKANMPSCPDTLLPPMIRMIRVHHPHSGVQHPLLLLAASG